MFNDAEPLEQTDNMSTIEGPKCNLVKKRRLKIKRFYTCI